MTILPVMRSSGCEDVPIIADILLPQGMESMGPSKFAISCAVVVLLASATLAQTAGLAQTASPDLNGGPGPNVGPGPVPGGSPALEPLNFPPESSSPPPPPPGGAGDNTAWPSPSMGPGVNGRLTPTPEVIGPPPGAGGPYGVSGPGNYGAGTTSSGPRATRVFRGSTPTIVLRRPAARAWICC